MAFPNISNRDQEHKSLTSHQEEELQTFWDTHGRFVKDHVETVKRYRETLLSPEDARLRCVTCVPPISLKAPCMFSGMKLHLIALAQTGALGRMNLVSKSESLVPQPYHYPLRKSPSPLA